MLTVLTHYPTFLACYFYTYPVPRNNHALHRVTPPLLLICGRYNVSDAALVAQSKCRDGEVRLSGGLAGPHEGMIEVCVNQAWGGVCYSLDDDIRFVDIVCRQLGYLPTGMYACVYVCMYGGEEGGREGGRERK